FRAVGIGYGVLSVAILLVGALRQQRTSSALRRGEFAELTSPLSAWLTAGAVALSLAAVALVVVALSACEVGARDRCSGRFGRGWSLAAADRHALHAGDGIRGDRTAGGVARDRRGHVRADEWHRPHPGRGDLGGCAVRGCLADQVATAQARVRGSAATLGDRAAAHDCGGGASGGRDLQWIERGGGCRACGRVGADRCCLGAGGRDRAPTALAHPAGPQRRKRA